MPTHIEREPTSPDNLKPIDVAESSCALCENKKSYSIWPLFVTKNSNYKDKTDIQKKNSFIKRHNSINFIILLKKQ